MRLVLLQGERNCEPGARLYLISQMAPGVAPPSQTVYRESLGASKASWPGPPLRRGRAVLSGTASGDARSSHGRTARGGASDDITQGCGRRKPEIGRPTVTCHVDSSDP